MVHVLEVRHKLHSYAKDNGSPRLRSTLLLLLPVRDIVNASGCSNLRYLGQLSLPRSRRCLDDLSKSVLQGFHVFNHAMYSLRGYVMRLMEALIRGPTIRVVSVLLSTKSCSESSSSTYRFTLGIRAMVSKPSLTDLLGSKVVNYFRPHGSTTTSRGATQIVRVIPDARGASPLSKVKWSM
ncbi:hypothetical protein HAX54_018735 [Datura stramonium]|uniref:Uncharacterized protein n=1 Tax=Datura stramonium TaxID=4076 RepID=A0ABS8UQ56_DATST|nr:hypothetical protein [Datura stramonium]